MQRKNNRGFMLTEALIVATIVISALIFLYTQIKNIINNYDNTFRYNNINELYALNSFKKYIQQDAINSLADAADESGYIEITDCTTYFTNESYCNQLITELGIEKLIFSVADLSYIKDNNTYNQDIKNFINYINPNSTDGVYTLIAKFTSGEFSSVYIEIPETDITYPSTPVLISTSKTTNTIVNTYSASIDSESGINYYSCYYGLTNTPHFQTPVVGTRCIYDGLNTGTTYYYKICATNGAGLTTCSTVGNTTTD